MSDFIIDEFQRRINNINFQTLGVINSNSMIYSLGTDSKIIGRIFEMYTQPILNEIAKQYNLILETPQTQTIYPDFILMTDRASNSKIAIDVKSTYIESINSVIKFTLGSYGSYMRNNKKNIAYCYTDYSKHYVIGFVYKRNGLAQESIQYKYRDRFRIQCPFDDVKVFIQEKYKIAGDKPGSGNTENIGSFPTKNINDLREGNGPFSILGEDIFNIYWMYYPNYRSTNKLYTCLKEFCNWFINTPNITALKPFDHSKAVEIVNEYLRTQS